MKPGDGQRPLRVGEALRHALAGLLARGELRDPGLREQPLTVSEVRMSPDLRTGVAYVCRLGGGDMAPVMEALARAAPHISARAATVVRLRHAPPAAFRRRYVVRSGGAHHCAAGAACAGGARLSGRRETHR